MSDDNSIEQPEKTQTAQRTKQDIDQEYSQCAMQLGDKEFKIDTLRRDILKLRNHMTVLLGEALSITQVTPTP